MDTYIINTPEFQLTQEEFLIRLLVAIGIGILIGLEREHKALNQKEEDFAGIRTFTLLSILGFLSAALAYLFSPMLFAVTLSGVIILTSISYWVLAKRGDIGGTSEFTTIIAVILGAMTFLGHIEVSLMITVVMVVLLSLKVQMQTFIGKVTYEEKYDLIRFVVVALLIFPFLPDETYGPYDVFNPRELGWVVVLISGLGFAGYVLMRIFGAGNGILITGILGGLVSSTAVTWIFSKKSNEEPSLSAHCAIAILAASSIMVIRVLIWVFIFNPQLANALILPLVLMFAAAIGITLYFFIKHRNQKEVDAEVPAGQPLQLKGAMLFAIIYTAILFAVAYANDMFGEEGIYAASSIAGLTDVDAITISVSKLAKGSLDMLSAQNAILIATLSNTLVKIGIALWNGSRELRKFIFIGYGAIFFAAIAGFVMLNI